MSETTTTTRDWVGISVTTMSDAAVLIAQFMDETGQTFDIVDVPTAAQYIAQGVRHEYGARIRTAVVERVLWSAMRGTGVAAHLTTAYGPLMTRVQVDTLAAQRRAAQPARTCGCLYACDCTPAQQATAAAACRCAGFCHCDDVPATDAAPAADDVPAGMERQATRVQVRTDLDPHAQTTLDVLDRLDDYLSAAPGDVLDVRAYWEDVEGRGYYYVIGGRTGSMDVPAYAVAVVDSIIVPAQPAACGIAVDVTADGRDHHGVPCDRESGHDGACHPDGLDGAMLVLDRVEAATIRAHHYAAAHRGIILADGTRAHAGSMVVATFGDRLARVVRTVGDYGMHVRPIGEDTRYILAGRATSAAGRTGGHRAPVRDDAAGYDRALHAVGIVRY